MPGYASDDSAELRESRQTDEANHTRDELSRRWIHTIRRFRYKSRTAKFPIFGSVLRGPMVNVTALRQNGESLTLFHGKAAFHPFRTTA